jgi:hypothetical protein
MHGLSGHSRTLEAGDACAMGGGSGRILDCSNGGSVGGGLFSLLLSESAGAALLSPLWRDVGPSCKFAFVASTSFDVVGASF